LYGIFLVMNNFEYIIGKSYEWNTGKVPEDDHEAPSVKILVEKKQATF